MTLKSAIQGEFTTWKNYSIGEKEAKYLNVSDYNCVRNSLRVRKMLEGNT